MTPHEMALSISERAKSARLSENFSRKTLAERSGVTESSLKRFEQTGQISFTSLLKIAFVLDRIDDFGEIFQPRQEVSLAEISRKTRERGRR